MITREMVQQRIEQLRAALTDAQAQVHGLTGALQDCEFWLRYLDTHTPDQTPQDKVPQDSDN